MNFDDRLRSALAHDPLPAVPPGFVDGIVAALPQAGRDRASHLAIGRVALAAVIVLVLGAFLAGRSGLVSGPQASPTMGTSVASFPSTALASQTTPAQTAWTHLGWQDVSSAFGESSGPIVAGTSWSGGYVLVGATNASGTNGAIWYSADGRVWQRGAAGNGGSFEGMRFVGVAASGGRLVAVAYPEDTSLTLAPAAVVWYSTDGALWYPSQSDRVVLNAGIAAGPDGFVVYGVAFPARPVMQYSSDGVAWAEATIPSAVEGDTVTSVVATADGFTAVGGSLSGTPGQGGPGAAWWSADGQTWHAGAVDSTFPLDHVVRWADGELRASSSDRAPCSVCLGMPGTITWSSTDGGRSWRSIGDSAVLPNGDVTIYDAGRLVRLQTQGTPDMPWATWSADGVAWVPLRMDGASPVTRSLLIVANGDTLIATGTRLGGSGGSQTEVLVGQLDEQPGPIPTPTLVPGSQDTPCKGTNPCGP